MGEGVSLKPPNKITEYSTRVLMVAHMQAYRDAIMKEHFFSLKIYTLIFYLPNYILH